jgi:hypothetical protein
MGVQRAAQSMAARRFEKGVVRFGADFTTIQYENLKDRIYGI